MKEKEAKKCPMEKNGLGDPLPSKNDCKGEQPKMTFAAGAPVESNQDSMTVGPRGPMLLQDVWFLEKLAHFDREVIPERRMHAKGSGAHGVFTVTHDISKYSKAKIFSEIGKKTEMFARFSTVAGERGAADAERDIRGFALKFYTEEGNWDMVGNNTPVFFFRDPLKFPDLNHAVKRDPRTNMRSPNTNWDFWSSLPEALHQVTIIMSDRGIPSSYRYMHGFSSHAYSMINADNKRVWVKFHFRSQQGIQNFTDQEAAKVVGMDRESHQRDLYTAIEKGMFPKWKMYIQVMTEEQANKMATAYKSMSDGCTSTMNSISKTSECTCESTEESSEKNRIHAENYKHRYKRGQPDYLACSYLCKNVFHAGKCRCIHRWQKQKIEDLNQGTKPSMQFFNFFCF